MVASVCLFVQVSDSASFARWRHAHVAVSRAFDRGQHSRQCSHQNSICENIPLRCAITCFFSPTANLPEWLYILLALISFFSFFTMSKAISVSTGPIFTMFAPNVAYVLNCRWSIGPSFSDILRDVAMATNLVAKMGQNYLPPALIAQNRIRYRYLNVCVNSVNDASKSF